MKQDKVKTICSICFVFSSILLGATENKAVVPLMEIPNLVEMPDYENTSPCASCEKLQYEGLEARDSFLSDERCPAVIENGVRYIDQEELRVGGKSSYYPTHEDILEDEAKTEEAK